jgi:hypothetical protein
MKDFLTGFGDLPLSPNLRDCYLLRLGTGWLLLEIAPLLVFKDQTYRMPNLNEYLMALSSVYIRRLRRNTPVGL